MSGTPASQRAAASPSGHGSQGSAAVGWPDVPVTRRIGNMAFWALCGLALLLVLTPAIWLAGGVIVRALPNWQWSVLTTNTEAGDAGGLHQAVIGTLMITAGVIILSGTISVLTGMYLSEFAKGRHRAFLRGGYEVLSGIPSIVLGLVGFFTLVIGLHWDFSLLAAVLVLTVVTIPYITKATETALAQVPVAYREGAEALGLPLSYTLRRIVLKSAVPGIITGLLVAVAISVGETAPLLYTAGWSDANPGLSLTHSAVPFLTYAIFNFWDVGTTSGRILSYDAALILLVLVLLIIIAGRVITALSRRHAE
jgi:phosphate transport system permease protein